jgi:hypothetical protein
MNNNLVVIVTLSLLALLPFTGAAQSVDEEKAITEVVNSVFKGMALGDSAMVHAAFAKNVTTATVFRTKDNAPAIRHESLQPFLKAVGTPHKEVWYEEVWNMKILVDGDFAQAWCDYAFYLDKTFSHCGVDAFHFHKTTAGWKIFHLADTRRKTGCDVPKPVQDKHR